MLKEIKISCLRSHRG